MGFSTDAIHVGQEPDPATGAVVVPIYQTSIFAYEGVGREREYSYSRSGNPTRAALEKCLAHLEGGAHGFAFASGVAATHAAFSLLKAGDHLLAAQDIYGGTYRLLEQIVKNAGISVSYADATDLKSLEKAFRPTTRLLFVETPSNPLMAVTDLAACAELAHQQGALLAADNTFMTPYLQRPLEWGTDVAVHSTTKYLNGHSDGIGGAVVVKDEELAARVHMFQKSAGAVLGPFDCWLVLRGVKTLPVRMRRHSKNAWAVAEFLEEHPKVKKVFYPGLPGHPDRELVEKQMEGFGGMVSFDVGSADAARKVAEAVKIFVLTGSLGGVEPILSHPATMSHSSMPADLRDRLGVTDSLLRLSVGLEDVEDLLADLSQALSSV